MKLIVLIFTIIGMITTIKFLALNIVKLIFWYIDNRTIYYDKKGKRRSRLRL